MMLVLAAGCDAGTTDDAYRQWGWTDTDGSSSGGYDSGSSESSSSTGHDDVGTHCVAESPASCCIQTCATGAPRAFPGDPSTFDCPVEGMEYNCGCDGTDLFDCDDFAYACENWGRNQGYNICTYAFSWTEPDGDTPAHAINIVEFTHPYDPGLAKYCFLEPQDNSTYVCWIQPDGEPNPPSWAKNQLCAASGGTCNSDDVACEGEHHPWAGEVCFNTLPAVCSRFRSETGLCPYTFNEVYDCSALDDSGDRCYWSCDDNETCGAACHQCDPVPPAGTTGDSIEYCASIDGNNETCYWQCSDGQSCGTECWQCFW